VKQSRNPPDDDRLGNGRNPGNGVAGNPQILKRKEETTMNTETMTTINNQLLSIVALERLAARLAFELSESVENPLVDKALELFSLVQSIQQQTNAVQETIESI
jgi:hypothetical protein